MRVHGLRSSLMLVVLIILSMQSGPAPVYGQGRKQRPDPPLPLNQTVSVALNVTGETPSYREFTVDVPENVFALEFAIEGASADLDLFLHTEEDELVAVSEASMYNERIRLSRISSPPLTSGRFKLTVAYQYTIPPQLDGVRLTSIPFQLTAHAFIPQVEAVLTPGMSHVDSLEPENGMVDLYEINVPLGTNALRIDISDTDADIDLFVNRNNAVVDPFASEYWAQTVRSTEQIIIDRNSSPRLRPGRYYALVIDQISDEYSAPYRISVHDQPTPPEFLGVPISLPEVTSDVERALLSTVEILTEHGGGSGVIVTPDGHILTNYHVVLGDTGSPADDITVGLSIDHGRPARELFLAEVIETAEDRDLALLRITSDRYGNPLPEDLSFPYLPGRFETTPSFGDDLRFIGYPSIGGTGSRASITYTEGIVSGYQQVPFGRLIKTDGEINEGSSGGAALDTTFHIVGLTTEVVGLDAGQLGYVYPITAIPSSWRRLIEDAISR